MRSARRVLIAVTSAVAALVTGCAGPATPAVDNGRVQVVTTTGILADLARNVGGDRVEVHSLVPDSADPHSYEPSLRDVRNVVYADVAFSNYALLEQHNVIKTLDANLRDGVPNVSLAEESVKYAAELIPLVENFSLDTIWLGLRVRGLAVDRGADRSSDVVLTATGMTGPGRLTAYLLGSFGQPDISFDSDDGFGVGEDADSVILPPDAHTHMSWAFTAPGIYRLTLQAALRVSVEQEPVPLGEGTFTFAVGVNPWEVPGMAVREVLNSGHTDLTVDTEAERLVLVSDAHGDGHGHDLAEAQDTVIEVPTKALHEIPGDPNLRFLGRAGTEIYQLPQAVLGAHVHGEIDPHLWHDVHNAQAYVELMRDTLISVDPDGAADYTASTAAYLDQLTALDTEVRDTIATIPEGRRQLVTTHDAFGYLAHAYDLSVAGFVTPNPAAEPSLLERRRLTETIDNLHVPAVFLEPNLAARSSTLQEVAKERGVRICRIYGDAFDDQVRTYVQLMQFNARSLQECLG
ncbi:anchored repeat ABC transporter, substrate-binding protein [Nakamurella sp. YIM 132084]|uniref:Anchored repeat ABC transporter, substrate-binding protein n=1 Tax=Nakamurella leprariae TaxID=2803911 RepID=A0A939C0K6_9ACTN|nr:anchored repeat ABC transporter, substrate-binding protein [Nakamurella leprariae]MBM9469330.1 anchored repeat ABC transporter, substrate-binding protein [Nakamurella leprariae]